MNEQALPFLVKTFVVRCYHCNRWAGRFPQWYGDDGNFDCECGSTAIKIREGRPFGSRSKLWPVLMKEFREWVLPMLKDKSDRKWVLESLVLKCSLRELLRLAEKVSK
jgi:hypothetical protein